MITNGLVWRPQDWRGWLSLPGSVLCLKLDRDRLEQLVSRRARPLGGAAAQAKAYQSQYESLAANGFRRQRAGSKPTRRRPPAGSARYSHKAVDRCPQPTDGRGSALSAEYQRSMPSPRPTPDLVDFIPSMDSCEVQERVLLGVGDCDVTDQRSRPSTLRHHTQRTQRQRLRAARGRSTDNPPSTTRPPSRRATGTNW